MDPMDTVPFAEPARSVAEGLRMTRWAFSATNLKTSGPLAA
jgi:hypothetical protein